MQLYHDYHQVCHSLTVSGAVVKIVGLTKCWFWRELSQEVTKMSKYFPFDILIDTLTSDTIYRSNLKNRYSIYIAYRYTAIVHAQAMLHLVYKIYYLHLHLIKLLWNKISVDFNLLFFPLPILCFLWSDQWRTDHIHIHIRLWAREKFAQYC